MPNGRDLVAAINANHHLMEVDNCPGVPVAFGKAIYGKVQDDDNGVKITKADMAQKIPEAVRVVGSNDQTAVWHFAMTPVHHFVVVPWYDGNVPEWVYTIWMAYENRYIVDDYVHGRSPAPAVEGTGYKEIWSKNNLSTMLEELLTQSTAWQNYFGTVGAKQATQIEYYKYKMTSLSSAITNVQNYTGI